MTAIIPALGSRAVLGDYRPVGRACRRLL